MRKKNHYLLTFAVLTLALPMAADQSATAPADSINVRITRNASAKLWRDPGDISKRDLFYGTGGESRQPRGPFSFVEEDLSGTSPKFIIRDEAGALWKVKLGNEARAETAATRLLWAVGYFTDEVYLLPVLRVDGMPRLRRGHSEIERDGTMRHARLERSPGDAVKIAAWHWRSDPLAGTREMHGLRVMMALVNNWDLKNSNNAVYAIKNSPATGEEPHVYAVSDVGTGFGSSGFAIPSRNSDLHVFRRSQFITKVTPEYVNFHTPSRPPLITVFCPPYLINYFVRIRPLGKHIPREDARWIGDLLARLSPQQIRRAFEAAAYSPAEVEGFARVIEHRISQLDEL